MWWLPPGAFVLDLLFADPKKIPHPVQGIAFLADRLEPHARRMGRPILAGCLVLAALLLVSASLSFLLTRLLGPAGMLAALYLAWSGLALGGLVREGRAALRLICEAEALQASDRHEDYCKTLNEARKAVGMLVSRDTSAMGIPDLYRSLAESLSENFNDAFTAPFFWLCLGGPVALWLYKTASTMDSMWGYKNDHWRGLGWASARLDDVLAYVPARISVLLMLMQGWLDDLVRRRADSPPPAPHNSPFPPWSVMGFGAIALQASKCDSPNAGWPMSAAAWLFKGKSGGPTPYDGVMVNKPLLGPADGLWTADNTGQLLRLVRAAGILGACIGTGMLALWG